MRLNRFLLILSFLLLLSACGGKKIIIEVPPPPSVEEPDTPGGGDTPPAWEANRGKVVTPSGTGWTSTKVRDGIMYYAFSGTDPVTGVKQEAFAVDLDLAKTDYVVQLTRSVPAVVTSDVHQKYNAIATMNAGYEAGSIYIRINGTNFSSLPNTTIGTTGVLNWKSEAAFFCDGVRNIRMAGAGGFIRPYKSPPPTEITTLINQQRTFYSQASDKYLVSSSPMLIDDFNPVGETFIDYSLSNWNSLNSEEPQHHQRKRHPRTAVALTENHHFIMFVVDGRTTISNGMSAKELTQFLVKYFNPQYALNMDGGGSTALCVEGLGNETTHLVNKPCDTGGRADKQRARDTHFVILAK